MKTFSTLISLVGENPLPIWLGIQQYAASDATILLVHSKDTFKQADAIKKMLPATMTCDRKAHFIPTDPYAPSGVIATLKKILKDYPDAALNYTGGTKVMSAFSVYQMSKHISDETALFSRVFYLEEGRGKFKFADETEEGFRTDVHLTLDDLCRIHKVKPSTREEQEMLTHDDLKSLFSRRAELCKDWRNSGATEDMEEDDAEEQRSISHKIDKMPPVWETFLAGLSETTRRRWQKTQADGIAGSVVRNRSGVARGKWLEQLTQQMILCLPAHGTEMQFTENPKMPLITEDSLVLNQKFLINNQGFESDVLVTHKRRLYYFSVTTHTDPGRCKSKMFEAEKRAEQVGGGLARSCVISVLNAKRVNQNRESTGRNPYNTIFGENDIEGWLQGDAASLKEFLES